MGRQPGERSEFRQPFCSLDMGGLALWDSNAGAHERLDETTDLRRNQSRRLRLVSRFNPSVVLREFLGPSARIARHSPKEARLMIRQHKKIATAIAFASLLFLQTNAFGAKLTLASDFSDFKVPKIYRGAVHYPNFRARGRKYAEYRTRISSGLKGGPNFAGKYSLIEFGCGSGGCVMGFVTDLTNGHVLPLPIGGEENLYLDLAYQPDSRLISARWINNGRCMQQKFTITGAKFDSSELKDVGPEDDCN